MINSGKLPRSESWDNKYTQLNKLKSVEKNRKGTILRANNESFLDEELPH